MSARVFVPHCHHRLPPIGASSSPFRGWLLHLSCDTAITTHWSCVSTSNRLITLLVWWLGAFLVCALQCSIPGLVLPFSSGQGFNRRCSCWFGSFIVVSRAPGGGWILAVSALFFPSSQTRWGALSGSFLCCASFLPVIARWFMRGLAFLVRTGSVVSLGWGIP